MRYRPEIDGLRAVAVIPVMLFHAGVPAFSGGFVGVDVFFVISGYLITSIIMKDMKAGEFNLIRFYERRARRILPALFLVIIVCIPFAWFLMDPFELKEFGQSIVATVTFSSNIYFYLKTGYFDTAAELKPLLHTWSLAVEEQYYILYPLFLIVTWHLGKRRMIAILITIAFLSLAAAHWAAAHRPSLNFFMLPTRAWELLLGVFIAFYIDSAGKNRSNGMIEQAISMLGLLLIGLSVVVFDHSTPFPSLYALLPSIGTVCIILSAHPGTLVHTLLSRRTFVGIGLISYSAYLWHQPVLAMARIYTLEELPTILSIACLMASLGLAYASKNWVEDYFRFSFPTIRLHWLAAVVATSASVLLVIGMTLHLNLGYPQRSALGMQLAQNYGLSGICSGAQLTEPACRSGANPSVILWGDSFAMHLGKAVNQLAEDGLLQATLSACPPIVGYDKAPRKALIDCKDFNEQLLVFLENRADISISTVVLSSTFRQLSEPEIMAQFSETLSRLRSLGYHVVVISPTPIRKDTLRCIRLADRRHSTLDRCAYPLSQITNSSVFEALRRVTEESGVDFVDLRDLICSGGQCHVTSDGVILFRDSGHLSNGSVEIVTNFLRDTDAFRD